MTAMPSVVLFVCTGNLCRSPAAASLLSLRLREHGVLKVEVRSAGTLQAEIEPPAEMIEAAQSLGVDLSQHRSHRMVAGDVRAADLVLGMTRGHVREAVLLDKGAFLRTFALRDFVRRAESVGVRQSGQSLEEWLVAVNGDRRSLDLVGESAQDDVADPMGGSLEGYRSMLRDVSRLCDAVYDLVWGAT